MTYSTTHAPAHNGLASFFTSLRTSVANSARRATAYHKTRVELEAMSDRDLADIGIARFMITDVAKQAALLA